MSKNARRAGWVGCNILYKKIPEQGKIPIISARKEIAAKDVLSSYNKIKNLQVDSLNLRGWMLDILNCINDIKNEIFTLQEIYQYADVLKIKHSCNKNINAKIRQQLQFLRDKGFIEFIGRGKYRKLI